jgi:hypothetical protein
MARLLSILYCLLVVPMLVLSEPTLKQMVGFLHQLSKDWSFPRVIEVAKTVNYTYLDPDIVGRVDITSVFQGAELNTEYLFGMFAQFGQSKTTSLIGVPLNMTIAELVVQGNTLSTSLIVTFNWTVEILPVQFNVFMMFNDEGKVIQYDTQLVRNAWLFPTLLPKFVPVLAKELGLPVTTDPVKLATTRAAIDICEIHEKYCTGANQQYKSTKECRDFIQNKVPLGDIWQAGQNTGICRYFHKAMAPERPSVHCPHIGPTGGGFCVDSTYQELITANPFPRPFIQLPGGLSLDDALKLV